MTPLTWRSDILGFAEPLAQDFALNGSGAMEWSRFRNTTYVGRESLVRFGNLTSLRIRQLDKLGRTLAKT